MKTKLLFCFFLFPFTFFLFPCTAQVPQGFNYQAIARDGSGSALANLALPVKIDIQTSLTGGTLIYEELFSSVTSNSFGLISLVVGTGTRTGGTAASFSEIDWKAQTLYLKTIIQYPGITWTTMGTSQIWAVPYSLVAKDVSGPLTKLGITGTTDNMEEALFEVKNHAGNTVFAVYNEGVRAYVGNGDAKGVRGGFAVGGYDGTKGIHDLLMINSDSARIYVDSHPATKGTRGGFAVGGYDMTKGIVQDYLNVSKDSVRVYVDSNPSTKGVRGGFAVGGYDMTKGGSSKFNYLNIETNSTGIIDPAENRIVWYPLKNAFLTGNVLISDVNDVGENSFASGYQSKAKGMYSQALGYLTIASADYSTAMGSFTHADGYFAFAMGNQSVASGNSSAAIGGYCTASAGSAMAMGWLSTASGVASFASGNGCNASAPNSQAMGWGSSASGAGSTAIGNACVASGLNSFAFGEVSNASNESSYAFGKSSQAKGISSYAFGEGVTAGSPTTGNCYAFGKNAQATGDVSYAFGNGAVASGQASYALGINCIASGQNSFAFGDNSLASGSWTYAIGYHNKATWGPSYAFGDGTVCMNWGATSTGWATRANANHSMSMGHHTISKTVASLVLGIANDTTSMHTDSWQTAYGDDPVLAIGNGNVGWDGSKYVIYSRSNAFTVLRNGKTGINMNYPTYYLDVKGRGRFVSDGSNSAGYWLTTNAGADRAFIGMYSDNYVGLYGNGPVGFGFVMNLDNGCVGIGVTSPTYRLQLPNNSGVSAGQAQAYAWATYSDARVKTDQVMIPYGLNEILKIAPKMYNHHSSEIKSGNLILGDGTRTIGMFAQELYEIIPEAVIKPEDESTSLWSIDYNRLVPVLIRGMQQQQDQIESQKQENQQLKSELQAMKQRMDRIEGMLAGK